MNNFIDVTNEMPPDDLEVEVRGDYTPEGTGYPKSYWNGTEWRSTEWRGTVAIRQWRIIEDISTELSLKV